MAVKKPKKIKPSDHAQYMVVKQPGKAEIVLPLNGDENKKLLQLESAKFLGTVTKYEDDLRDKIDDKTSGVLPIHLEQLGKARRIAHELLTTAFGGGSGSGANESGDNSSKLIAEAVKAGQILQDQKQKLDSKNTPIDAEAVDVPNNKDE